MTYTEQNLFWRGRRLYQKISSKLIQMEEKAIPLMEITPHHTEGTTMFYVEWPDGVISADYYNITRAKDLAVQIALAKLNKEEIPLEV